MKVIRIVYGRCQKPIYSAISSERNHTAVWILHNLPRFPGLRMGQRCFIWAFPNDEDADRKLNNEIYSLIADMAPTHRQADSSFTGGSFLALGYFFYLMRIS
jgi:hypothetical protein